MVEFIIKFVAITIIIIIVFATIKEVLKSPYNWIRIFIAILMTYKLTEKLFIWKYGNFTYNTELDFILNSIKNHFDYYIFSIISFLVISFVLYVIFEKILSFVLRDMFNKSTYKLEQDKIMVLLATIIKVLNIKGICSIKDGKIKTGQYELKDKFPKNISNTMFLNQVYTMVIIIEIIVLYWNNVFILISGLIATMLQVLFMLLTDKSILELHRLNLLLKKDGGN